MKNHMQCGHSENCHHKDEDCMKYILIELTDDYMALIDTEELGFFDELLERGKTEDIEMDEEIVENLTPKIVYGALLSNHTIIEEEKAMEIANDMTGNYAFLHIEREKVTVCKYSSIKFFPELSIQDNLIPFAALMRIPYPLENIDAAVTLTPAITQDINYKPTVWEYMVNRPFLLACRGETAAEGLAPDNFESFIDMKTLMESYRLADMVLGVEGEE